jgi:hypothetical protein
MKLKLSKIMEKKLHLMLNNKRLRRALLLLKLKLYKIAKCRNKLFKISPSINLQTREKPRYYK